MAAGGQARLGSRRDGVWEAKVTAYKWQTNGPVKVHLWAMDRAGRYVERTVTSMLSVVGAVPDVTAPVLQDLSLDKSALDVTAAAGSVTVTAKVTDAYSGVVEPFACLMQPSESGPYSAESCDVLAKVAGTVNTWKATLPVEQGALTGEWNLGVGVSDRAGQGTFYFSGEAYHREASADEMFYPIAEMPAGKGLLSVTGSVDTTRAAIDKVIVQDTTVGGEDFAVLRVHATDAVGEGVRDISFELGDAPDASVEVLGGVRDPRVGQRHRRLVGGLAAHRRRQPRRAVPHHLADGLRPVPPHRVHPAGQHPGRGRHPPERRPGEHDRRRRRDAGSRQWSE